MYKGVTVKLLQIKWGTVCGRRTICGGGSNCDVWGVGFFWAGYSHPDGRRSQPSVAAPSKDKKNTKSCFMIIDPVLNTLYLWRNVIFGQLVVEIAPLV